GYTPLHIAAMFNRTEVFDLLVHYGGDLNTRDYSGKKPRSYNTIASTVSHDTQKRIIQRRNSEKLHRHRHHRHHQHKTGCSHGSSSSKSRRHSIGEAVASVIFRQ
ncbi:hypothetical protein OTU49_002538, partial [Cherax quadricarinatus]